MRELIPILIALACPLMMIVMMRSHGHGAHGHSRAKTPSEQEMTREQLKRQPDELNGEIAQRSQTGARSIPSRGMGYRRGERRS